MHSHSLTLCALMDSSFWFDIINLGWSTPLYILRGHRLYFSNNICISFLFSIVITNSVDPDEMLHVQLSSAARGLHFGLSLVQLPFFNCVCSGEAGLMHTFTTCL